jgi:hypothetical protein
LAKLRPVVKTLGPAIDSSGPRPLAELALRLALRSASDVGSAGDVGLGITK